MKNGHIFRGDLFLADFCLIYPSIDVPNQEAVIIEIGQLNTLLAVANTKSFSRAADELKVTQSAISQSIKALETKLNVKLFKRSGKEIVLTIEGAKLYHLASRFLGQLESTIEDIINDKNSLAGKVSIGTLTGLGKSWLGPLMLDFAKQYPSMATIIKYGLAEELVHDFDELRLDLLILPENEVPRLGERIFLGEEKINLVYPKDPRFAIDHNITLEKLSAFPTILFAPSDFLYLKWCRGKFGAVPKQVNTQFVVNSHGGMLNAVAKGMGIAVLPTHVLKRSAFFKDKINSLGEEFEVNNGGLYLVYHKGADEYVRIKKVIDTLATASKDPF